MKKKWMGRSRSCIPARAAARRRKSGKYMRCALWAAGLLFVFVCYQNMSETGQTPAMGQIWAYLKEEAAVGSWKNCMMVMVAEGQEDDAPSAANYLLGKLEQFYPICGFCATLSDYDTQVESDLGAGLLAENTQGQESNGEQAASGKEGEGQQEEGTGGENQAGAKGTQKDGQQETAGDAGSGQQEGAGAKGDGQQEGAGAQEGGGGNKGKEDKESGEDGQAGVAPAGKMVEISREKLNDFDYLVQNFYQVDRTTTVDGSQLNAEALLGKSMKLTQGNDNVQILIYHTHSQEGYQDSVPGDTSTGVVGVAEYLAKLLRENYGFHVLHHTGEYDVEDRDNAYSYAGPALEQILAENPTIEVVIDLHRDGVADTTHLVSEVNGKQTAQVMFFNGLSRTTANGDIPYLANPYLEDNLAFSLQMKLAAEEYYPGFARRNYLKGYRYNLHYCPKSLLVEVGAQTNTLEEAMNAMEPLAELLHKVLAP